jgi:hypothetical protein
LWQLISLVHFEFFLGVLTQLSSQSTFHSQCQQQYWLRSIGLDFHFFKILYFNHLQTKLTWLLLTVIVFVELWKKYKYIYLSIYLSRNEMITSFKVSSTLWLRKFQIPFWIICVVLITLDLVFGLLRVFYFSVDLFVTILSTTFLFFFYSFHFIKKTELFSLSLSLSLSLSTSKHKYTHSYTISHSHSWLIKLGIIYIIIALATALYFFIVGHFVIRNLKSFKKSVVSQTNIPKKLLKKECNHYSITLSISLFLTWYVFFV